MKVKKKKVLSSREKIIKFRKIFKKLKKNKKFRKFSSSYFQVFRYFRDILPPFNLQLSINISSNNVFLNLSKLLKPTTIKKASAGVFQVKITKKRLKHTVCVVLQKFLNKIKPVIFRRNLIISLTSPKFLRKKILKLFRDSFMRRNVYVKIKASKCFNGCRQKKKRRKKRARLKIFKIV